MKIIVFIYFGLVSIYYGIEGKGQGFKGIEFNTMKQT